MSATARRRAEPKRLRDRAYARFTERLLARELTPGQFVTQRELVALTGLTLGAVREVIPRLEAEGLLVTAPQRGLRVVGADVGLLRDAFRFRRVLEREAVAEAARTLPEAALAAWQARHEALLARAEAGGDRTLVPDAAATDRAFHEAIADSLGNAILSAAWRVNWIKTKLAGQGAEAMQPALVAPVMREHLALVAALAAREPAAALAAAEAHCDAAQRRAFGL
jgi:DNA-binding GntR family transcriptional regulator